MVDLILQTHKMEAMETRTLFYIHLKMEAMETRTLFYIHLKMEAMETRTLFTASQSGFPRPKPSERCTFPPQKH
jgi:hypothetical protein